MRDAADGCRDPGTHAHPLRPVRRRRPRVRRRLRRRRHQGRGRPRRRHVGRRTTTPAVRRGRGDRRARAARPDPRRTRRVLPRDRRGVAMPRRSTCAQALRDSRGRRARLLPAGRVRRRPRSTTRRPRSTPASPSSTPSRCSSRATPSWAAKFRAAGVPDRRRRHQEPARRDHHPPRARPAVRGARPRARPHLPAQRRRQHGLQEHARALAGSSRRRSRRPSRSRATSRRARPAAMCTSARATTCRGSSDRKFAFVRLEGHGFGNAPTSLEYKLEVWDSPNSAGVVIDAIRLRRSRSTPGSAGRSRRHPPTS